MSLIKIPKWLSKRPISHDDPLELRQFFLEEGPNFFSDISIEGLKEYYHRYSGDIFYKLIRILGFYGVQFYKKLSTYSGPHEHYPDVVNVFSGNEEKKLSSIVNYIEMIPFFSSCNIHVLKQLHGVPFESLMRMSKQPLTRYQMVSILPVSIMPVHDDFFVNSPIVPSRSKITAETDNKGQLEGSQPLAEYCPVSDNEKKLSEPIESLGLSFYTRLCLQKNGIHYISELVDMGGEKLYAIPSLRRKYRREINEKLLKIGLCVEVQAEKILEIQCGTDDEVQDSAPIDTLELSVRSRNCLRQAKIRTIAELKTKTDRELLNILNFGRKCLKEIRKKIRHIEPVQNQNKFSGSINFNSEETLAKLCTRVCDLRLSVRSRGCLKEKNIQFVWQLTQLTKQELIEVRNLGRTSINEIRKAVVSLGFEPGMRFSAEQLHKITTYVKNSDIDFNSKKTLAKLCTRVCDLRLSVRSRGCLKEKNIQFVWQLTQLTKQELIEVRNLGRTSINEIRKAVVGLGFVPGMRFSPEQLHKITTYEPTPEPFVLSESIKSMISPLTNFPLEFLNDRENLVAVERLFKVGKKKTLEELAHQVSLSRERVRQIQKSAVKKIKQHSIKELRAVTSNLKQIVDQLGGLASIGELKVDISNFTAKEQVITSCLLQMMDEELFIDWEFDLISSKGKEFIIALCNAIEKVLFVGKSDKFFTKHDLAEVTEKVTRNFGLSSFQGQQNLTVRFCEGKKVVGLDNQLCCGKLTKQDRINSVFKASFPNGLEVYKKQDLLIQRLKEFDPEKFHHATPRSVLASLTNHPDVLLWERGFFIHKDHVSYNKDIVQELEAWIEKRFERGHSRFQIDVPFDKFRKELLAGGIPNQYALYTLLRLQANKRIGQRKFPTLVDLKADVDLYEGIIGEMESYFLEAQQSVPYSQLKEEFVVKRGWKEYSLNQNISTHSELIFPWHGNSYIHLEFMDVNYEKLDELIDSLRAKLNEIQSAYSLKGAKKLMNVLWEEVCPAASVRTMIKLIRLAHPEDLQIERYFIQFSDNSSESFSVAAELEEFFLDKGIELNSYELHEEFCVQRGWSEIQLYGALRKARLFRSGKSTYLHPTAIGWNALLSQEVHRVLEVHLEERNKNHYPHMQIGELIDEYVLPELPQDIQWTRQLLKSAGEELGDFLFFDDAYIFQDNSFGIEDLDDIVAYLIARNFKLGIAKKLMVEELLWREGILESGYSLPSNLFFEESSIQLREESNEVELSPIGISRYAKKS
jgi:DNA-directed RNA polymerase alpha subunit